MFKERSDGLEAVDCPLLQLPAELRSKIFSLALSEDEPVNIGVFARQKLKSSPSFTGPQESRIPASVNLSSNPLLNLQESGLLATSREIRNEALAIHYGINTFRFANGAAAVLFLRQLGPKRISMLRSIQVVPQAVRVRALLTDSVTDEKPPELQQIYGLLSQVVKAGGGSLRKDALLIPQLVNGNTTLQRLTEIDSIRIEDTVQDGGWKIVLAK